MEKGETLTQALENEGYGDRNPKLDGSQASLPYYGKILSGI